MDDYEVPYATEDIAELQFDYDWDNHLIGDIPECPSQILREGLEQKLY